MWYILIVWILCIEVEEFLLSSIIISKKKLLKGFARIPRGSCQLYTLLFLSGLLDGSVFEKRGDFCLSMK